jgi:hypothetical protein
MERVNYPESVQRQGYRQVGSLLMGIRRWAVAPWGRSKVFLPQKAKKARSNCAIFFRERLQFEFKLSHYEPQHHVFSSKRGIISACREQPYSC